MKQDLISSPKVQIYLSDCDTLRNVKDRINDNTRDVFCLMREFMNLRTELDKDKKRRRNNWNMRNR